MNCYAERMSRRLAAMAVSAVAAGSNPGRKASYLKVVSTTGKWSRDVVEVAEALNDPKSWRVPRRIFVNSMSDLFHEKVSPTFIQRVFDVMNDCPHHVFQVLTKRPERVRALSPSLPWAPNIWMGTSVENSSALSRVADLRRTAAEVKFLSLEPLLGPLRRLNLDGMNWVIAGGESGPGARPVEPDWIRAIRDKCIQNEIPFFFKQWGGANKRKTGRFLDGRTWDEFPK
jgi:protein gp37